MIFALVADILFSSKIRTAAKHLGVDVVFARAQGDVIEQARNARPKLVLIDLNSVKMDPLASIAALKRDVDLRAAPIVGFVSHVQVDLIEAAREAGADEVMARSLFVMKLPDLLQRARAGAADAPHKA